MKDGRTVDSEWKLLREDWRGSLGLAHVDSWAHALGVEQVGYLSAANRVLAVCEFLGL